MKAAAPAPLHRPHSWLPSSFFVMASLISVLLLIGCDSRPGDQGEGTAREVSEAGEALAAEARDEPDRNQGDPPMGPRVIFLGDSLTAGYGLDLDQAFPAVLQRQLEARGERFRVVNAGVSGDTSAGGLSRLPWLLRQEPDLLVVGLGANDGLRGLPLEELEANLRGIVSMAQEAGVDVLLLGMRMPPSLGPDYSLGFDAIYPRLAEEFELPLVPFLLESVAARPELNQADGIHPNAKGSAFLADTVEPFVVAWVEEQP